MSRFWAAEDLQIIRWVYPHVKTAKLAAILGRKVTAVSSIANILGIHKTAEFRPVGTIRADPEGFLRIKVRDTKVWPLLNRHIWEQHKGPIPPSHAICFRDGKRANCAIENLECISRAELASRNQMWNRYPRDLALAIQMNGALKRKMRRLARE